MKFKALVVLVALTSFAFTQEAQQRRIVRPINNVSAVRLRGSLPPRARADLDQGPVAAAMPLDRMSLVFCRTGAQQAALDQLLAEQQDPNSPNYHHWLTPEEFGDRFGLAQADVDLVSAWLTAQGFTVEEVARSRTWIAFSGIAAQVEATFNAPLHNYLVNGTLHYAPNGEVAVPEALSGVVAAVTGLHDFRPHAHSQARRSSPRLTSNLSGNHYLAPGDFGTIYNLPDYVNGVFQSGNDGTGQTIGIVSQTSSSGTVAISTVASDTATFRSVSGLPAANLTLTPVGSPTMFTSGDASEANLDVQWSGAVAPNAAIILAYSNNALLTSLPYLVSQSPATVISLSFGDCEANFGAGDYTTIEAALKQAQSQGQTVTASAGDDGASDCDGTPQNPATIATHGLAVDYPASSQYVIAMGGTQFTGDSSATVTGSTAPATQYWDASSDPNNMSPSAFSYIPETTWNEWTTGASIVSTGGGASKKFPKPVWQSGTGVPNDNARDVPDLALNSSSSHDQYITCSQGSCQTGYRRNSDQTFTLIGGTSAASPTMAGIAALINQKLGKNQGNLNSLLYPLAATAPWAFNDITTGDNKVPCQSGTPDCPSGGTIGFSAGVGYDKVTGLGSVDATALINALNGTPNPHFLLLPAARYETVASGTPATVAVSVTPKEGFTGNVALTCTLASSLTGASCSFDNTTVAAPGSANLTIQPGTIQGSPTGTVTLQGASGSLTNSVAINVTFTTPDFAVSSGNSTETVTTGGSTTDTITATPSQGFTGSVAFSCTGTAGLTCSLNPNPVSITTTTAATTTLTVNAASSATTGSITITATSGSITHTLQIPVTVNVVAADFTLTVASPVVSISSGGLITDNLTIASVGGFNSDVALTCSVPSSLGTTSCTISPTTVTGGSGSALVTIHGAVLSRDLGAPLPFNHGGLGTYATFVFALGMAFTASGAPFYDSRKRSVGRGPIKTLFGSLLLCVMFGALSCGGGGSNGSSTGPTPLTGNLTITGAGGGITHTATINVTVQ